MPEEPTSESLAGPDGRTSSNAQALANMLHAVVWKQYATTKVHQSGYGPASFEADLGEGLIARVSVDVRKDRKRDEGPARSLQQ